jgi:hypothetical protein
MTQRWERGKEAGLGTRLIKEEEGVRYDGAQGGHPMCGTAEEGGGQRPAMVRCDGGGHRSGKQGRWHWGIPVGGPLLGR